MGKTPSPSYREGGAKKEENMEGGGNQKRIKPSLLKISQPSHLKNWCYNEGDSVGEKIK